MVIFNPLPPKISLVILLTVCQMILIIQHFDSWEFGIRSISNPITDISIILITCLHDIVQIY